MLEKRKPFVERLSFKNLAIEFISENHNAALFHARWILYHIH
jgi:hypothetical protein